jgi:hypothetical protein
MQTFRLTAFILAIVSTAAAARDQVPREQKSSLSSLEYNGIDNTVMSDSQQYAPNLVGLRQYLDTEVASDSRDYNRLNHRLQELEEQDQRAFRAAMIPAGLGVGSLLIGSLLRQDEDPTDARLKSIHETGGRLMLYGVGGLALGFIVHSILAPDDQDVRQFIQFHNGQAHQTSQLDKSQSWSLGILTKDTVLSLSYQF